MQRGVPLVNDVIIIISERTGGVSVQNIWLWYGLKITGSQRSFSQLHRDDIYSTEGCIWMLSTEGENIYVQKCQIDQIKNIPRKEKYLN